MQGLAQQAAGLAAQPYVPYKGARVAGFNADQNTALSRARGLAGQTQPYFDQSGQILSHMPTTFDEATQQHYMNPYIKNVIDATQSRAEDDFARQMNELNAQKIKNGTWGSNRYAIQSAISGDLFNKTMMEQRYKGLADAYDKSYNMFSGDRTAQMQKAQGLAGLGAQIGNTNMAEIATLGGLGDKRQAVQQVGLDTAYNDFLNQRDWTKNQLDWLSSIYHGYQGTGGTSTATTYSPSSNLQTALGLGLAGLGAAKSL